MSDILKGLNAAQKEAVTTTEGFVRVIAGAGSGKTRALSRRFAYLVKDIGIMPGNILCVTFTNKSANEMRQRIHNLTGDNDTGYINTFHGFCVSILQEDSHAVQYPKSFLVLDNSDIDSMLKVIYEERGLTLRDMTFGKARDMIEIRKMIKEPGYYMDMLAMPLEILKKKYDDSTKADDIIFYGYLYQEKKCFALDYNDLINFSLYIFRQNPEIRLKWQKRLEYIMIDEFQDIDAPQYRLMQELCAYHKNLFIVGDPDQTIYTWRGASVGYLLEFDKAFPNVKTIMMNQNYRSTPEIIAVGNSLIDKNKQRIKKDLIPTRENGPPVVCYHGDNANGEANWIVNQIRNLQSKGVPYKDITILYRAHYVTRTIEEVFLKENIPYAIYSGVQFFNRMEIKDALSYLRLIAYKDDLSFLRIANAPKRNMGQRRIKFLQEYAQANDCLLYDALKVNLDNDIFKGTKAERFVKLIDYFAAQYDQKPISELLNEVISQSEYEQMLRTEGSQERLDNLAELKQSIYEFETSCGEEATLEHYLSHVALFTNADAEDKGDKVKMMTVHTAKGLEFPYVFLCAMNEGIFPSRKTRTKQGMEEERRLAFVAMTRAKDGLYLSEAQGRNFDGAPRYPSRFVLDVDQQLLEYANKPKESLIADAKNHIEFSEFYLDDGEEKLRLAIGQRVKHEIFGAGAIVDVDEDNGAYIIQFDNMATPRKLTFRAKLQVE